jgi:uncharacterized protein (TIGR02145 family)
LPTKDDWQILVNFAGGNNLAGDKLKADYNWSWNAFGGTAGTSGIGTDEFWFSALPGGSRLANGNSSNARDYGHWWTATEYENNYAYYRRMSYDSESVSQNYNPKNIGYSVRCVKND